MSDYTDEDLVYVDPDTRTVVGPVEWTKDGKPKPLLMEKKEEKPEERKKEPDDKKGKRRRRERKRYYPWGTYRSMKKLYRIEGKEKEVENYIGIDEAIGKAMEEPYWD